MQQHLRAPQRVDTILVRLFAGKSKKKRKKEDEVDKAFKEAEVGPDHRELAAVQSQTLEALFEIFFRVLKQCTNAGLGVKGEEGDVTWTQAKVRANPLSAGVKHVSNGIFLPWLGRLHARCTLTKCRKKE